MHLPFLIPLCYIIYEQPPPMYWNVCKVSFRISPAASKAYCVRTKNDGSQMQGYFIRAAIYISYVISCFSNLYLLKLQQGNTALLEIQKMFIFKYLTLVSLMPFVLSKLFIIFIIIFYILPCMIIYNLYEIPRI
jgi:hypothetical protein